MLAVIILISGVINLILGLVVLLGATRNRSNLAFALFSFTTFVWSVFNYFIYNSNYPIFVKLSYVAGSLLMMWLLVWAFRFSFEPQHENRWLYYTVYTVGIIFALSPFMGNLLIANVEKSATVGFSADDGPLMSAYILYVLAGYLVVLMRLAHLYRKSADGDRQKARVVLIGFSLYGFCVLLFGLILPFFGYTKLIDFDVPSSMIFVAFTSYAIVYYKWMRIKTIAFEVLAIVIMSISLMEVFLAETAGQRLYRLTMLVVLTTLSIFMVRSAMNEVKRKEELEKLNAELAERKAQLQKISDSLAVANSKLKELDRTKSDFMSRASHDLRAPITSFKGYVSMLEEGSYGAVTDEQKAALRKAYSVADNMGTLVEDLFNASKLESGGMKYDFKKVHIEDICQQIVDTLYPKAKERGLYLHYEKPAEPLPELLIDGPRIRESISNLVDNGLKYSEKGGVTLKLERAEFSQFKPQFTGPKQKQTPTSGPMVRITVSDTGIGIPKEEIPFLFARFSRGRDTSRLNAKGTGLGLYICKGMIEGNGGKIWAESAGDGKGSRFIVELPVEPSREIAESKS